MAEMRSPITESHLRRLAREALVAADRVREVVTYDPDSGLFRWNIPRKGSRGPRSVAGSRQRGGRITIRIDGMVFFAHRLAWLYMHGVWPKHEIDHRNHDQSDNRLVNLREATHAQNMYNRRLFANNRTGIRGVRKHGERWSAGIGYHGKHRWLGIFASAEEASAAYRRASQEYYGDFAWSDPACPMV